MDRKISNYTSPPGYEGLSDLPNHHSAARELDTTKKRLHDALAEVDRLKHELKQLWLNLG